MEKLYSFKSLNVTNDRGEKFALGFNLGDISDKKYGDAKLKGHLFCILPFGEFPQVDLDHTEEVMKKCIDWATANGLVTVGDNYYVKFHKVQFAILTAYFIPAIKLKDAYLNLYLQMFFFAFDDIMDNFKDHNFDGRLTYQAALQITNTFTRVIRGEYATLAEIPGENFPLFKPICATLIAVRQAAMECNNDITHFVEAMADYFISVAWEHSDHNETDYPSKNDYMYKRNLTIGFYPTIEAVNLIRNITLSPEIRKNPLYQQYCQEVCKHVFLINDLLSIKKEIANNETDNLVLIKQQTKPKKYCLQSSIDKVIKQVNDLTKNIKEKSLKLKQFFPEDSNLNSFIKSMEYFMDGHIFWYENCQRYGDIKFEPYRIEPKGLAHKAGFFPSPSKISPVSSPNTSPLVERRNCK